MGSFLSRALLMAFGYAYPAYECFKTVQRNKPEEIDQLRFWCQYWILVAVLTVVERIGDTFISWLPLYNVIKLAFVVYLWHPKWKGTTYVYNSFFQPYVVKHEKEIDRNLLELKVKAGEVGSDYWNRTMSYGQIWLWEMLQYFSYKKEALDEQKQKNRIETLPLDPSEASVTKQEQSETDNIEPQSDKPMVLAQSCVKTSTMSRLETLAIQPPSDKKEVVFKRHGIWRIFKPTAH